MVILGRPSSCCWSAGRNFADLCTRCGFLDTGDPALRLPVPRLRCCLRVMDFASDIDPDRIFRRGRSVGPWVGHRVLSLWLVSHCWLRLAVLTSYGGECLPGRWCSGIPGRKPFTCHPPWVGRECITILFVPGKRVTLLYTSCLLCTCVVGVTCAVWTVAVDCNCFLVCILRTVVVVHHAVWGRVCLIRCGPVWLR